MKKYLIIFFSILSYLSCYSQQLEWFKTFKFKYPVNDYYNPSGLIRDFGENIALISTTCGKNVIFEETQDEILFGESKNPEPYIIIFNKNGEIKNKKIIYTRNGGSSVYNFQYNKFNGLSYFIFNTNGDSISFDSTQTWLKINRRNANTNTTVISFFDYNLNNIHNLFLTSPGNKMRLYKTLIDKSGNIYCCGYFEDSLLYNNKLILKAHSDHWEYFLLKINNINEVDWIINTGLININNFNINESRNILYVPLITDYNLDCKIWYYNDIDSFLIPKNINSHTVFAEFDISTGYIKRYFDIFNPGNDALYISNIKNYKNNIFLSFKVGGESNKKIIFDSDTLKYNVTNGNIFLLCLDANTLKKKFVNFFDYTENIANYGNVFELTDIYNDSIYTILGVVGGNFNFSFNGQNNYSEDYLKTRPSDFASDYFATYTTSNQLKDVWYLNEHPYNQYPGFEGHPYIFEKDGDIYISGNIKYYASLGLGKREFNYSTYIDKSLTLVKYNYKPTAYFKYKNENDSVLFKNVSTGFCSYKWDFGDGTSTTQKSPYHKFASKTQSYKVSLITTNSCGSDTFYRYYSFSAGLTSFKYNSQIKIYPNPIRGNTIKIEMPENTEIKSVKIYSPTGQQLDECSFDKTEKTNYTATIGSKLSKGIYYVKIILDDNTGYVTKVIIGE